MGRSKKKLIIIDCNPSLVQRSLDNKLVLDIRDTVPNLTSNSIIKISDSYKGELQTSSMAIVNKFGAAKVLGRELKESLSFFNSSVFFYHRFRILHKLSNHLIKVAEIRNQLNNFDQICLYTTNKSINEEFKDINNLSIHFLKNKKEKNDMKSLFAFVKVFSTRIISGFFQYKKALKFSYALIDRPTDYIEHQNSFKNPFLHSLLLKIKQPTLYISEVPIYGFKGENKFKLQSNYKAHKGRKDLIFSEFILFRALIFKSKKWRRHCDQLHEHLVNGFNPNWSNDFKFLWKQLVELKSTTNLYLLKEMAYQDFFKKSNIKNLMASDENSLSHRVILNAAKLNGIKTYGIQHGAIGIASANYIYSDSDHNYSPIPDLTFLWGNYWKDVLVNVGNYPEKKLMVVGQLRTDEINHILNKTDGNLPSKKRILFATQPMPEEKWRERAIHDVLKLASKYPEDKFIIRPHPRENDPIYFKKRIKPYHLSNIDVDGKADLYQQLSETNLLITCFSTVALEALYFKIPVLLIDYNKVDGLNFAKKGLAPLCETYSEIESNYNRLLSNNFDYSAIENHVKEYAYKIDGKVADRILEEVYSELS